MAPKNNQIEQLVIGPIAGLDASTTAFFVQGSSGTDLLNIWPDYRYQSYITAKGRVVATDQMNNGGPVIGLGLFERQALGDLYVSVTTANGTMYFLQYFSAPSTVGNFTLPSGVTLNVASLYSFVTYASQTIPSIPGWMFLSDGISNTLKINAQTLAVTQWQINPPTYGNSFVINSSSPSSSMNGVYYYRITYANAELESSPGQPWGPITVTNLSATLQNIPSSSDSQVTTVNIYRLGGTLSTWLLVGSISNGTTTFVDSTADLNVTGQELVLARDPPPPFLALESHMDCIWGFGYNTSYQWQLNPYYTVGSTAQYTTLQPQLSDLWYSNYAEPWSFDNVNRVLPCGRNTGGDVGVALASIGSMLCALKYKTFWAVYGNSPADFLQTKLFDIGCMSRASVAKAFGLVFWLSDRGVYAFDGSDAPTYLSKDIKYLLDSMQATDLQASVGFMHYRMYCLSFPTLGITLAVDIDSQKWYKLGWATNAAVWNPFGDPFLIGIYPYQVNLVLAANTTGASLDVWFAADTDYGNPISSHIVSRISDGGQPSETKQYRYCVIEAPTQVQSITITSVVNGNNTNNKVVSLNGPSPRTVTSYPPSMVGQQIQITLSVASSQLIQIDKLAVYGYTKRKFNMTGVG